MAQFASQTTTAWSGPIPPPSAMEGYERAMPGSVDRIIGMAERQASHRQSIEAKVVEGNVLAQRTGQVIAGSLLALIVIGSFVCVLLGHSGFGIASLVGALGVAGGTYLYGKRAQRKELAEKQAIAAGPRRPPPTA
jgi:uncharacterized membrane protein